MNSPDPNKLHLIGEWLRRLAELTSASNLSPPTAEKLGLIVDMLAENLSSDVFCRASLGAMARRFTWFPAFADLEAALIEWRDEEAVRRRMAARPALTHEGAEQLSPKDRTWLDWFHPHRGEYPEEHCRSLLAAHAPAAYAVAFGETVEQRRERRAGLRDEQLAAAGAAIGREMRGADSRPASGGDEFGDRAAWASPPASDKPAPATPRHIPDADLLGAYERQAADLAQPFSVREAARTRADTIRRKLGRPVAANDATAPQEDARP